MSARVIDARVVVHDLRDGDTIDYAIARPGDYVIKKAFNLDTHWYGMLGVDLTLQFLPYRLVPGWLSKYAGDD